MWEHGLGDVSVDMILARAEVLKGSFYHFFPAKSDLLLECVENVWRRQSEELAAIYAETEDPRKALRRHMKMLRQEQAEMRKHLGFVPGAFNMSMPNSILRDEPRITAKLRELMTSHQHYLEIGLRRLAESDGLAQPADTTARLLRYALSGALLSARMHNSLKPLDDFEMILAEVLDAG
jgi:TetR/AcrR family transcriptional repressor of nem operon